MHFYAFLLVGLGLLAADLAGVLRVSARRLRWWRWIGLAAAAGPGLAPALAAATGRLVWSWPFPLIAFGYGLAFAVFALGILLPQVGPGRLLRRSGYIGLLLLAALPSWVLIVLTPLVAIAGVGLASSDGDRRA